MAFPRPSTRVVRLVAGWLLLILGVAGLVLPFLQGILFLLLGLYVLAPEWPWARRQLARLRGRFPEAAGALDRAGHKMESWFHRITHRRRDPGP